MCVCNRSAAEGRATSELQAQTRLVVKIHLICAGPGRLQDAVGSLMKLNLKEISEVL